MLLRLLPKLPEGALGPGMRHAVAFLQPAHLHLNLPGDTSGPVTIQARLQLPQASTQLLPFPGNNVLIEFHVQRSLSCKLNVKTAAALPPETARRTATCARRRYNPPGSQMDHQAALRKAAD